MHLSFKEHFANIVTSLTGLRLSDIEDLFGAGSGAEPSDFMTHVVNKDDKVHTIKVTYTGRGYNILYSQVDADNFNYIYCMAPSILLLATRLTAIVAVLNDYYDWDLPAHCRWHWCNTVSNAEGVTTFLTGSLTT